MLSKSVFLRSAQKILIILMPKLTNRSRKTSKFIRKLNQILTDPQYVDIVAWLPESKGFQIIDSSRFVQEIFPNYFRHKNMASFVRQLNMYGFTRSRDSDQHAYFHPRFLKGNMNSIRQIHKKSANESLDECKSNRVEKNQESKLEEKYQRKKKLSGLCAQLFSQNHKLKRENSELNSKVHLMQNSLVLPEEPNIMYNSLIIPSQDQLKNVQNYIIVSSEASEINKIQQGQLVSPYISMQNYGFYFDPTKEEWERQMSYLSMINGMWHCRR